MLAITNVQKSTLQSHGSSAHWWESLCVPMEGATCPGHDKFSLGSMVARGGWNMEGGNGAGIARSGPRGDRISCTSACRILALFLGPEINQHRLMQTCPSNLTAVGPRERNAEQKEQQPSAITMRTKPIKEKDLSIYFQVHFKSTLIFLVFMGEGTQLPPSPNAETRRQDLRWQAKVCSNIEGPKEGRVGKWQSFFKAKGKGRPCIAICLNGSGRQLCQE